MPKLRPPLATPLPALPRPRIVGGEDLPAVRSLELGTGSDRLARLDYHLTAHPFAVMQLLHIEVHPEHRRQKIGTRLIEMAIDDAQKLLAPHRLRRVHVGVAHKSHIHLRALLTHLGFHHTATVTGLLKGEDMLSYIKSYT